MGKITEQIANESLDILKIDEFDWIQLTEVFKTHYRKYDGGPVGIETIAAAIGEDARTIEDVCEPFLLQAVCFKEHHEVEKFRRKTYRHLGSKLKKCQLCTTKFILI